MECGLTGWLSSEGVFVARESHELESYAQQKIAKTHNEEVDEVLVLERFSKLGYMMFDASHPSKTVSVPYHGFSTLQFCYIVFHIEKLNEVQWNEFFYDISNAHFLASKNKYERLLFLRDYVDEKAEPIKKRMRKIEHDYNGARNYMNHRLYSLDNILHTNDNKQIHLLSMNAFIALRNMVYQLSDKKIIKLFLEAQEWYQETKSERAEKLVADYRDELLLRKIEIPEIKQS